ncbi:hypothetical protein [Maribacter luteus]|uniref:hypothetical protein n=1 Tax=Maribacter luteus TaxID=2594478 RepID=UPI00249298D6|nr:hypothetical protein [Maribacter luteus]
MESKKFYHYTHSKALSDILDSGYIKLATASVYGKKEKAVAWVSTNEHWEHTATKMVVDKNGMNPVSLTFEQQLQTFGCTRIQVKNKGLQTWAKLKHTARMDLNTAALMEVSGIKNGGHPSEWFGSLKPIRKEDWLGIEIFENGEWVKVIIKEEQL